MQLGEILQIVVIFLKNTESALWFFLIFIIKFQRQREYFSKNQKSNLWNMKHAYFTWIGYMRHPLERATKNVFFFPTGPIMTSYLLPWPELDLKMVNSMDRPNHILSGKREFIINPKMNQFQTD